MIEYRCAWCGRHLYDRDDGRPRHIISHGICKRCAAEVRREAADMRMERVARLAGLGTGSVSRGGAVMSTAGGAGSSSFPAPPPLPTDAEVEALR